MRLTQILVVTIVTALLAQPNLLTNGDFESGTAGWSGLAASEVVTATGAPSGSHVVHLTSAKSATRSLPVTVGHTYTLTGWIKVDTTALAGSDWGYWTFGLDGKDQFNARANAVSRHVWTKFAFACTATKSQMDVNCGFFGPVSVADISFDDIRVFEKTSNQPPVIDPRASLTTGSVPLSVSFTSNGGDTDGAIATYQWLFGDGGESALADPAHTYLSRGVYTATLTAFDNDGAKTSKTLTVTVTDNSSPSVSISSPSTSGTFSTSNALALLSGTAAATAGQQIVSVSWDNVTADTAGMVTVSATASVSWNAGNISLKPGVNEILVTSRQSDGRVATSRIIVTRSANGPVISAIMTNSASVKLYEKFEATFDVVTVAEKPFFSFDANPPAGVRPGIGITVEGVITRPGGDVVRQPCFYAEDCAADAQTSGVPTHFAAPTNRHWKLRYAPTSPGVHSVRIEARDASGSVDVSVATFVAVAADSSRHGFVRVSKVDPRYQEYSDYTLYMPTGPAWGNDYASYKGTGLNWERCWMGGSGMYSTNWSRWKSSGEIWGNEGGATPLTYSEHYPAHELSGHIWWPEGYKIWIGAFCDNAFTHQLVQGHVYQVKVRLKTAGLIGPANPSFPWGLMMKSHGWPGDSLARDLRADPSMIPVCSVNVDWHTAVARYTHTAATSTDFSLYLDNVRGGEVFVDQISIREVLTSGALGGELVRNSLADQHTYVEQRPAAWFDWQVEAAAQNGVALEYVVQDKNDWIPNHLTENGTFGPIGTGYYAKEGTKTRWLQKQWWRYLAARYGYSTGVRAWELCNEGPPDDGTGTHARATQEFSSYMHGIDAHRHLVSTSFWCCWEPTFWKDRARFPDVDYGDIHWYFDQQNLARDVAFFMDSASRLVAPDDVGIPVQLGELGVAGTSFDELKADNDGTWYHNLLWSQLNSAGLSAPGYWHPEHMNGFDRKATAAPFGAFCRSLDVNKGGYGTLDATISGSGIRVQGQKNVTTGKAHVWIQNTQHDWYNVMHTPSAVGTVSGNVTIRMAPNTDYPLYRYDTYSGATTAQGSVKSTGSGDVVIPVNGLDKDVAYALGYDPRVAVQVTGVRSALPAHAASRSAAVTANASRGVVRVDITVRDRTRVRVVMLSLSGRVVGVIADGQVEVGSHGFAWHAAESGVPAGLYILRVNVGKNVVTRAVTIMQ